MPKKDNQHRDSTLAALLKEKPKRGRPKHAVQRQSVYVAMSKAQKEKLGAIARLTPSSIKRADIPDLTIILLSHRLAELRHAVSERSRELPEGITDLIGLYYLWDLPIPETDADKKWTSIRLSPAWAVEFGRLQGTFNALFGATRSDVFDLAVDLFEAYVTSAEFKHQTVQEFEQSFA